MPVAASSPGRPTAASVSPPPPRMAKRRRRRVLAQLGRAACRARLRSAAPVPQPVPADPPAAPLEPLWEVRGRGKCFVDLQNDVTTADVRLAAREGYEHVEHMKRYTTHAMGGDQGRIGGLLGSAVLAQARGVPLAEVGQVRPRPFVQPVPVRGAGRRRVRPPLQAEASPAACTTGTSRPAPPSSTSACGCGRSSTPGSPGWDPVLAEAARRAPLGRHHRRVDARQDRRAGTGRGALPRFRVRQHVLDARA